MLILENAKEAFAVSKDPVFGTNSECEFFHLLSEIIPDTIDVDTLILACKIALEEEKRMGRHPENYISIIPQYVSQCASFEFAHEFREKYIREVLGLTQEPLPDVDYGYNEVEKDVIDISNKDKGAVLAALYNASIPVGMGIIEYNPATWDERMGNYYLEHIAEKDSYGNINLHYVMGRLVRCRFEGNLVKVALYNLETEQGLAQKAIATVPNKTDVKKKELNYNGNNSRK